MHYCLSKDELKQLVRLLLQQKSGETTDVLSLETIHDDDLRVRLDHAQCWQEELGSLAYLFAHLLEGNYFSGSDVKDLINLFYDIPNRMYFTIQEFDENFIDYMMKRRPELHPQNLEDNLIKFQNDLSNYHYDKETRL